MGRAVCVPTLLVIWLEMSSTGACRQLGRAKSWCQNRYFVVPSTDHLLCTLLMPQSSLSASASLPTLGVKKKKRRVVVSECRKLSSCPASCQGSVSQSVQSFGRVWLFATLWTASQQASPSITNSRNLLKLMSIKSVMPSNHLIPYLPLLLSSSIFPSIRVFSSVLVLHIR